MVDPFRVLLELLKWLKGLIIWHVGTLGLVSSIAHSPSILFGVVPVLLIGYEPPKLIYQILLCLYNILLCLYNIFFI